MQYYFVGGYVRDELLGVKNKDVDFAVEADSYEAMKEDILSRGMLIFQERPQYYAIRGRHPVYGGVDFTLCRKDGFYSDNRRPDSVEIGTIYDDLARRDFTVNAIAKSEDGQIIDPHQGRIDLNKRVLRCVGDTVERMTEDPLRLLRAVRFHIVRGFILDEEIKALLRDQVFLLNLDSVSIERTYEELRKCYDVSSWMTIQFMREYSELEWRLFASGRLVLEPNVRY